VLGLLHERPSVARERLTPDARLGSSFAMLALLIGLALAALLGACFILPVIAILRTRRLREFELRLIGVEAALMRLIRERRSEAGHPEEPVEAPKLQRAEPPTYAPVPAPLAHQPLEALIGQKWLGWIAVVLIFFGAAFFLKYAFDNRWIGERGRVSLGILAGLAFTWMGHDRFRRGWRYFSQALTGGGITLLYLSIYGAFAYYQLIAQQGAFAFLVLVVAAGQALAVAYDARSIASLALLGGFLTPVLLATPQDRYVALFTYLVVLDAGVLALVIARQWRWIGSLAFAGTHLLFWTWYEDRYTAEKLGAALLFQVVVFLLFVAADLAPHWRQEAAGPEQWVRSVLNAFVFFGTLYSLLETEYRPWLGALAAALAGAYAALGRWQLARLPADRRTALVTLATALAFATVAIPVQLEGNWVTIGWSAEALALLWAASQAGSKEFTRPLRVFSTVVFALAAGRLLFVDTPWGYRPPFQPVLNAYFLSVLAVAAALGAAVWLWRDVGVRPALAAGLAGAFVLWIGSSIEIYSYFDPQPGMAAPPVPVFPGAQQQQRWAGHMSLSVLWTLYAAALVAAGFRLAVPALRTAGLGLFGLTLLKVVLVDISELRQFYRIVAVLALGFVLLGVAWAYQRMRTRLSV
jgi:uncharacterized membrane protein